MLKDFVLFLFSEAEIRAFVFQVFSTTAVFCSQQREMARLPFQVISTTAVFLIIKY